ELEAMEDAFGSGPVPEISAERRQVQQERRGGGEADPGREGPGPPRAAMADGHADLARGRAGQELAERDEIGIGLVVEPAAANDEGFAEVTQMSDRAAEAGQAQHQEGGEDLSDAAKRHAPWWRRRALQSMGWRRAA